jgi:phage I-like protein
MAPVAARFHNHIKGENAMDLLKPETLALLALGAKAGPDDIHAAVAALKAKADEASAQAAALKSQNPDPAKYVPVEAVQSIQSELAALKTDLAEKEVDNLVAAALQDGRLHTAQEAWARNLGTANPAALTEYLATATPFPKGNQTGGREPSGGETLTESVLAVARQMGVNPEDIKKFGGLDAASGGAK